jgi:hypothetical protein
MNKWIWILGLILSSGSAFADWPCIGDRVSGNWENGYGDPFQIVAHDCDHVDVIDLHIHHSYSLDFTGKTALRIPVGGVGAKFDLRTPEVDYDITTDRLWVRGTLMWKIAPSAIEVSPGLGIKVGVMALDARGNGQFDTLEPFISGFVSQSGDLGNLFDEGVNLVVTMLNRFEIYDGLSKNFAERNTLRRVN